MLAESGVLKTVGTFLKDKEDGELTALTLSALKNQGASLIDIKDYLDLTNITKTASELRNLQIAGAFTEFAFQKLVGEVEETIEGDKQVKHSSLQRKVEALLDDEAALKKFAAKFPGADAQYLDFPLPVMVQSGGDFSTSKFQLDSNANKLQSQAIYINCCGKYGDMATMASRTLIVNPKEEQKQAYLLCHEAHELLINSLKVGSPVSAAFRAARDLIASKNPKLQMHSNFGFGTGYHFKEDLLLISESNDTLVKPNMAFHVRIALANVHHEPARSVVAIGDTVFVTATGTVEVVTQKIQKKYAEISYSLDDSEEEEAPKTKALSATTKPQMPDSDEEESEEEEGSDEILVQGRTGISVIKSARLRSKADT